ncbi:hypothetical protein HPB49_001712 [Dermacentor silvarum]|uniref:Uncharacterized protein n=1 Tax=Dermacentor silvarum TaxID=543639 RepID=A0ACB8C0H2_DERSI|nr:hypothetical protein HPB49_001712 [Dermacentor silvarum]
MSLVPASQKSCMLTQFSVRSFCVARKKWSTTSAVSRATNWLRAFSSSITVTKPPDLASNRLRRLRRSLLSTPTSSVPWQSARASTQCTVTPLRPNLYTESTTLFTSRPIVASSRPSVEKWGPSWGYPPSASRILTAVKFNASATALSRCRPYSSSNTGCRLVRFPFSMPTDQ